MTPRLRIALRSAFEVLWEERFETPEDFERVLNRNGIGIRLLEEGEPPIVSEKTVVDAFVDVLSHKKVKMRAHWSDPDIEVVTWDIIEGVASEMDLWED